LWPTLPPLPPSISGNLGSQILEFQKVEVTNSESVFSKIRKHTFVNLLGQVGGRKPNNRSWCWHQSPDWWSASLRKWCCVAERNTNIYFFWSCRSKKMLRMTPFCQDRKASIGSGNFRTENYGDVAVVPPQHVELLKKFGHFLRKCWQELVTSC
jgi:hypothetical protein